MPGLQHSSPSPSPPPQPPPTHLPVTLTGAAPKPASSTLLSRHCLRQSSQAFYTPSQKAPASTVCMQNIINASNSVGFIRNDFGA